MAGAGKALAGVVAGAVALAGCIAQPAAPGPAAEQSLAAAAAQAAPGAHGAIAPLELAATGCLEGGGHSVHPKWDDYLPAPWEPADVIEDVGPVLLTSEWWAHPEGALAQEGETMGNYHATVTCDAWTLGGRDLGSGHVFGFVGMKVAPPPFDAGPPADRHYLVTVLATSDEELHHMLHDAGFHATLTQGVAEWTAEGLFHNVLDTADHGVYESLFRSVEAGPMVPAMRLWWQMEHEDGTFSPIALDLRNTGGVRLHADGYGWFHHLRTEDHSPLPGAGGETPGLAYRGFDRVVTWGPRPAVLLDEAYIHS